MKSKSRSVPQLIEEQIHRWQLLNKEHREKIPGISIRFMRVGVSVL